MDMMLNTLPSRTWNKLGINEACVTVEEQFKNHTPRVVSGDAGVWTEDAGADYAWADIQSGCGSDIQVLTEGAVHSLVKTAPGQQMDKPLILAYEYGEDEKAVSRLRLHAARDSTLSVILTLKTPGRDSKGVSALQTKLTAEAGAHVKLYVVQLMGSSCVCFNDIGGVLDDGAQVQLVKMELGFGQLYTGAFMDLKGQECDFTTDAGYYVRGGKKLDMNYVALHHGKKTTCRMDASGTLEDGASKCFRGTIDFQRGCAGAKGAEHENVLLLGDDMINQSVPLILCKEEDVEGEHGASIGRLDEKVLFYLGSRGISEEAAQQIIAQSRIDTICGMIPDEDIQKAIHEFKL